MSNRASIDMIKGVLLFLYLAFGVYLAVCVGVDMTYARQTGYIEKITTIASIIFGVSGAWLAIMYPKAMQSSQRYSKDFHSDQCEKVAKDDRELLLKFIHTMIVAILTLVVVIFIPFVKEFISSFSVFHDCRELFRSALFFIIYVLSSIQLFLFFSTLMATIAALNEIDETTAKGQILKDFDDQSNR